jgi:Clostripain family.
MKKSSNLYTMNKSKIHLLFLLFLLLFSACEKDELLPADETPVSRFRSVLVYLGVDNNFHAEAQQKIEQLRTNWHKDTDGNLLVYADAGSNPVLIHIYHSELRGNVADTIAIYPATENSANPAALTRTLERMQSDFPANSYGMVVLSHATGWAPAEMSLPTLGLRSIVLDRGTDEPNNYMELPDFANAIPYKLDFVVFDACFMASVEVAYELKEKTDYIVASPAEVLAPGFVHSTMMSHLFRPQPDLTAVAREFYEYYNQQSSSYRSATVSVIKTSALEALADFTKDVFASSGTGEEWVNTVQTFGYKNQKIYFDLGDYLQKLSPERYDELQTIFDHCVLYKAHTPSYYSDGTHVLQTIDAFSGLSVYIPQTAYPAANEYYERLKWTRHTTPIH